MRGWVMLPAGNDAGEEELMFGAWGGARKMSSRLQMHCKAGVFWGKTRLHPSFHQ